MGKHDVRKKYPLMDCPVCGRTVSTRPCALIMHKRWCEIYGEESNNPSTLSRKSAYKELETQGLKRLNSLGIKPMHWFQDEANKRESYRRVKLAIEGHKESEKYTIRLEVSLINSIVNTLLESNPVNRLIKQQGKRSAKKLSAFLEGYPIRYSSTYATLRFTTAVARTVMIHQIIHGDSIFEEEELVRRIIDALYYRKSLIEPSTDWIGNSLGEGYEQEEEIS